MASQAAEIAIFVFPLLVTIAGVADVASRRIPNWLTGVTAACFLPFALATGLPVSFIGIHLATACVLLLLGYALFAFGMLGGGDAKMIAVSGLWLGFPGSILFVLFSAVAGGVLALAISIWFMSSLEGSIRSERLARLLSPLAPDVPYGFALAAGAILATPFSWWMRAAAS